MYMTNRTTTRKQPLAFFFALLLLLAIAVAAPVNPARADNLSQGLELYQQKKFREATPYLEKAAQEGHEEAIAALDVIYAADAPVVPANDKAAAKGKTEKTADVKEKAKPEDTAKPQVEEAEGKAQFERATVTEDKKDAEDRAFMRKAFFLGTAVLVFLLWIVQYFLFRKLRNQHYRKMTPEELAEEAKKNKKKK